MAVAAKTKEVNLCWATGNYHQRWQLIQNLVGYLKSGGDFEYCSYDKDVSFEYVSAQVRQNSLFDSSRRLIVLHDWPSFQGTRETLYKRFGKLFEDIADGVILFCDNLESKSKNFLDIVARLGKVYTYPDSVETYKAAGWISGEIAKRGRIISGEDADKIAQAVGQKDGTKGIEVDALYCLLDKLCLYVGKRKTISLPDIIAVCTESPDFITWSLFDALDKKDFCEAVKFLNIGFSNAKNFGEFAETLLNSMIWRYTLIFLAREGIASGLTNEAVVSQISGLNKLTRKGSGFLVTYSQAIDEATSQSRARYGRKMVDSIFDNRYRRPPVSYYNRKEPFLIVKGSIETLNKMRDSSAGYVLSDSEIILNLELLLMAVCGVIEPEAAAKVRRFTHGKFS
jgi:DNA polymerase III delta subunit